MTRPTAPTPPSEPDRCERQAAAVLERLMRRFRAETRLPDDAHAPVRDAAFHQWLGSASGMQPGRLEQVRCELADLALVPLAEGRERLCIALRGDEPLVGLVLADPFDRATRLWLEARLRQAGHPRTRWYVAPAREVLAFYERLEREQRLREAELTHTGTTIVPAEPLAQAPGMPASRTAEDESPVLRFVSRQLQDALAAGASDVHFSSTADGLLVRYRLDGVLQPVNGADGREFAARVIRRLKVLADLDVDERARAQDGRLQLAHGERERQARLSVLPTRHGEDAVLRLQDGHGLLHEGRLDITALGLDAAAAGYVRRMARAPHGLLIVTGPAGSGKTTTLYGVLGEGAAAGDKLVTLEDPIEAPLDDAVQIAVDAARGMSFAHALRAALRHDADRLMIGELRDAETAQLAVQAALAGHRVYASVAAGSVFDAIGRLTTLGVDAWDLAAALNGVVAQRLLRTICTHCAQDDTPAPALLAASGLPRAVLDEGWTFRRGMGCPHCRGSGYRGRQVIAQTLTLDLELKGLIAARAAPGLQREAAQRGGLITLREAALELVCAGHTTLEEANRVTSVQE